MPQVVIACASGKVLPYRNPLAAGLRKPAPGSFVAEMGGTPAHVLFCEREPEIETKDGED
jgi:hypothetical protein